MSKAIHPYAVIVRPLITEKATILAGESKEGLKRSINPRTVPGETSSLISWAPSSRIRSSAQTNPLSPSRLRKSKVPVP